MSHYSDDYEDDFEEAGEENAPLKYTSSLSRSSLSASHSSTSSVKADHAKNSEDTNNSAFHSPSKDATDQKQVGKPESRILAPRSSLSHHSNLSLNAVFLHVSNITAVEQLDPEPPNGYCQADRPDDVADEDDHDRNLNSSCSVTDQCSLKDKRDTLSERTLSKSTSSSYRRDSSSSASASASHSNISSSGVSPFDSMPSRCEMAPPEMQDTTIGPVTYENNQAPRLTEENISPLKVMYSEPSPVNGKTRRVSGSKHSIPNLAESSPTSKKNENNANGSLLEFSTVEGQKRLSLTPCSISFGDKNKVQNGLPALSGFQTPRPGTTSNCNAVDTQSCPSNINTSVSHLCVSSKFCTPQIWKRHTIVRDVSGQSSRRSSTAGTNRSRSEETLLRSQQICKSSRSIALGTNVIVVENPQDSNSASKFTTPRSNKYSNVCTPLKSKKGSKHAIQSCSPLSHANANEGRRSTTHRPRNISPSHIETPSSGASSHRAELLLQIRELKQKLNAARRDKVRAMGAKRGGSDDDRNWDNEPDNAPSSGGRWRIRRLVDRLRRENRYLQNLVKIRQDQEPNISVIMCMITEDMKHAQEELREIKRRKRELTTEDRRAAMAHRIMAKSDVTQEEMRAKQQRDGDYSRAALQSKVNEMREKLEGLKTSIPHLMERVEALSADVQRRGLSNIKPNEYENLKAIVAKNEKVIEKLKNSIAIHTSNECLGPIGGVNCHGDEYLSQVPFPAKAEMAKLLRKLTQQVERKEEELRNCRLALGMKPPRDPDLSDNLRTDRYKLLSGPAPIRALTGNTSYAPANQLTSCVPSYTPPDRPLAAQQPGVGGIPTKDAALALRTKKDDEKLPQLDYQKKPQQQQQQQKQAQLPDVRGASADEPKGIVRLISKKSSQEHLNPASSLEPLPANGSSADSPSSSALESLRRRVAEVNVEYVDHVDDLLEKYREEVKNEEEKSEPPQARDVSTPNHLSLSPSLLAMKRSDSLNEMEEEVPESIHSCGSAPSWLQA